jgi:4-hydroxymandelate oxidase
MQQPTLRSRRQFLQFLAASPLLTPSARAWALQTARSPEPGVLTNAKDVLDVMDFEEAARHALPPAHWGYLASGVDDDLTLKTNVEAFKLIRLKPRRLVDVSRVDLRIDVFGAAWDTPIFICPVGSQRAFHPEGELVTARAARAKKTTMILSSSTTHPVEDVAKVLGAPPWYQLYMPLKWE